MARPAGTEAGCLKANRTGRNNVTGKGRQFAVIAGSGFQDFGTSSVEQHVDTRFGKPSSPIRELGFENQRVYLLARHGDALLIPPHAINYRANLQALQQFEVDSVVAINTVGVITADRHPGQIAIPDQLIDYTSGREHSIYDGSGSEIDHIDFTDPFSSSLRNALLTAAKAAEISAYDGGVYAVTQGPRLETTAEVDKLEKDGVDYVGMTAMPEAALARELGMEYACLSLLVNYAAGRGEKSIHADIEASTVSARAQAMAVLNSLFCSVTAT